MESVGNMDRGWRGWEGDCEKSGAGGGSVGN